MNVKQIATIVNDITKASLGDEATLVTEDLSNIVDVGTSITNAIGYDGYVNALVNRIGKTIFVDRAYSGRAPKILMDAWEFGSVLQKVHTGLPEGEENESWELEDGHSYDQDIFYKPSVEVKFYNSKTTFEIPMSFTDEQLKQSFLSREAMGSFISMLYNSVERSLTVKFDGLIMRTINNYIGELLNADDGVTSRNLLAEYNTATGESLTVAGCMQDSAFLRFASREIALASNRMETMSSRFNLGHTPKFTPKDMQRIVLLDVFSKSASMYLYSPSFHDDYVKLPQADEVSFWQGSGDKFDFDDVSGIDIKTAQGHTVKASGIIACIFDRDAVGVSNYNRRTPTHYNGKAEFWNNWYKEDAGYFNDFNENGVVFYVAEA